MAADEDLEHSDLEGDIEIVEGEDDIIDTDDGGAIVELDSEEGVAEVAHAEEFYANLVPELDSTMLDTLATTLLEKIELDKKSREKRIEEYTDALKRTGLGDESPGGASFQGASRVVDPILIEAVVDYSARAVAELMPPDGPVKMYIPGETTKQRLEKAERKAKHMNWQFRTQMKEFKSELEQLQTQEPLGGVAYLRLIYDAARRRPVPTFIPVDDIYLPFVASSFYTAERVTWAENITTAEFQRRVDSGMYVHPKSLSGTEKIPESATAPEESKAEEANQKIEGKTPNAQNIDGQRRVYLSQVNLEIDDEKAGKSRDAPYLVSIDGNTREIVAIVRNWEEPDEEDEDLQKEAMFWIIEWPFIPWRGAYPIGLNQVMAGIPAAVTGALRALMDSAHINNLPTLLKLKGANVTGQTDTLNVAQVTEIQGGIAGDDIRKLIMAVPYNEPSATLFSLMGSLTERGRSIVRTSFDNLAEHANTMPATTAMALIEQGMKVMSTIHLRQWTAMDNTISVLHRINRLYITDEEIKDDTGTLLARRSDYQGPLDCIPTADPQVFSDAQRFAQINLIAQRSMGNPLYDQRKVEEMILERTRIPNAKDLLIPEMKAKPMNAVNENVAMTLGRPVTAFPQQDHLAHIQVLLDFLESPFLGSLTIIAPTFIPAALGHLKEHIVYWYVAETVKIADKAAEQDITELMEDQDEDTKSEMDKLLATISTQRIIPALQDHFGKIPEIIQRAQALLQQLAPQMPTDPAQATLAAAQLRAKTDMDKTVLVQEKTDQRELRKSGMESEREMVEQSGEDRRQSAEIASREKINQEDNMTALTIAAGEIEAGEKSALSTGTGINPNP